MNQLLGLRREFGRIRAVVVRRWQQRGVAGFALTASIASAIVVVWVLDHSKAHAVVSACCGERVGAALPGDLLRLPGSLLAPAPNLPVWGSVVQVVAAFGIAEAAIGVRRTLAVAGAAHLIATLAGRFFVGVAPRMLGGLPPSLRGQLDTGPSAATVGLAVYLAIVLGCTRLGFAVVLAIAIAFAARTDLAGREHLVAMSVGAMCAAGQLLTYRLGYRFAGRSPAGAEDEQSYLAQRVAG